MAFRPPLGPSASHTQVQQLQALLAAAGYGDFRSARGPFRLTQRQGMGKFTSAEADALIGQLEAAEEEGPAGDDAPAPRETATPRPLRDTPTELLVAELRTRGWDVAKP